MSENTDTFRAGDWLAPRHWPLWSLFGLLWLSARLPFAAQLWIGRRSGDLLRLLLPERRAILRANLQLAFPGMDADAREALLVDNYRHTGMSLAEMGALWFGRPSALQQRLRVEGMQHLQAARAGGRGVILLQAHFTTLEFVGNLLGARIGMDANYDDPKNPLYAAFLRRQRERFVEETIANRNIRRMVRRLRQGRTVWFSPDQWVAGHRGGILSHYFGRRVFTSPGTARIAALTGAAVVPLLALREPNGQYRALLLPALEDFPGDDLAAATQRVNDLFEAQVRAHPAPYLWLHKRFKRVDDSQPDIYS